jgi:hypothetical protein
MNEIQEMLPSLTVTALFAAALLVVARREEAYAWWKALLAPVAGQASALGLSLLAASVPPSVGIILAWGSLLLVAAVIALACRWMRMGWRDAVLVGVFFVVVQFAVSQAGAYLLRHPL